MKRLIKAGSSSFTVFEYQGVKYGVRVISQGKPHKNFAHGLKMQITEIHPYDNADYIWCKVEDGYARYVRDKKVVYTAYIEDYLDSMNDESENVLDYIIQSICATLYDLNADIDPEVAWN